MKRLKHLVRISGFILAPGILVISFQNFTALPLHALKPTVKPIQARLLAPNEQQDIRDWAPQPPEGFQAKKTWASPRSGSDLESIGQNWVTDQTHLLTEGADQKLLDEMNRRMSRWFGSREPASTPQENAPVNEENRSSSFGLTQMRFTTINRLQMDFSSESKLSCLFKGDSLQWDFSQPLVENVDLHLRHESRDNASSMSFNYNW